MTERDKISLVRQTLKEDLRTADIVSIFNEWCEANRYNERCYPMDELDEQLSEYEPTKILRMAEGTNFSVFKTYFYITDLEDLISFNFYDEEDSPIDIDELAKEIVCNNADYGNKYIRNLLCKFEKIEEEDE